MEEVKREELNKTGGVRSANFELMKCLAVFLILISHIVPNYNSSFTSYINLSQSYSFGYVWALQLLRISGQIGDCLFLLSTGYFMVCQRPKLKKVCRLAFETLFYSWVILLIYFICRRDLVSLGTAVTQLMPFFFSNYWFITCYLLLYIISPLLNRVLYNASKQTMAIYLCFFFLLYSVVGVLKTSYYYNSLIGTIFVYLLAGYFRLHEPRFLKSRKALVITLAFSVACFLVFIAAVNLVGLKISRVNGNSLRISYFVSFPVLLLSVSVFGLFKSAKIKNNRVINKISSCSLGVYLITGNYFVRNYALMGLMQIVYDKIGYGWILILIILGLTIICFAAAVITDLLRKATVEKMFDKVYDKLAPVITKTSNFIKTLCIKILS